MKAIISNQFPVNTPKPKTAQKYAIYAGKAVMNDTVGLPYPVLVSKINQLKASGIRFLSIKPVK